MARIGIEQMTSRNEPAGHVPASDGSGGFVFSDGASGPTDAADITYTPADSSKWNGNADPGNADDALDQLADRTKTLEGASPAAPDASAVTYTPSDNSKWTGNADPGDVDDALNQLASRTKTLEGAAPGTGDVVGPASATDGHLAVFDGTTGKLIKDGGAVPAGGSSEPLDIEFFL